MFVRTPMWEQAQDLSVGGVPGVGCPPLARLGEIPLAPQNRSP